MTNWEFIKLLDKRSFAKWLAGYLVRYTIAIDDIEEPTEEDVNDIIEIIYQMLDEEVQTTTCEHHDISRED